MKRLNSHAVQYFGLDLNITMPWVAVDEEGYLIEYEKEPMLGDSQWCNEIHSDCNFICKVDLENLDWKDTKREFVL